MEIFLKTKLDRQITDLPVGRKRTARATTRESRRLFGLIERRRLLGKLLVEILFEPCDIRCKLARLDASNGRQDHTVLPYANRFR